MTFHDVSAPRPDDDQPTSDGQPTTEPAASAEQAALLSELQRRFAGPLPPPEILAGYEQVLPGASRRIFDLAERQATHRQELERVVVIGGHRRAWAGLIAGFVVSLTFLGASAWLIHEGHSVAGAVLGTVDLTALVAVFVLGRISQSRGESTEDKVAP